jgi:hypothetical protein
MPIKRRSLQHLFKSKRRQHFATWHIQLSNGHKQDDSLLFPEKEENRTENICEEKWVVQNIGR